MDMLLTFWVLCLVSPVLAWVYRRLRLRARGKARLAQAPSTGSITARLGRSREAGSSFAQTAGFAPRMSRGPQSIEHLVADLSRLERQFAVLEISDAPNKMMRMQALSLAYDDVLCECCAMLGLPTPSGRPLDSMDRVETECELVRHGLTW